MNIRTATIWTTGLVWIVSNLMVFIYFFLRAAHYSNFSPMSAAFSCLPVCFIFTSPLLVSGNVAIFTTSPISLILLLSTSILYGIGMFGALCSTWGDYDCMSGIQFFSVAIASLFYMVPTWIIVIILNSLYVKQPPTESADNSRNEVAE